MNKFCGNNSLSNNNKKNVENDAYSTANENNNVNFNRNMETENIKSNYCGKEKLYSTEPPGSPDSGEDSILNRVKINEKYLCEYNGNKLKFSSNVESTACCDTR